MTLSITKKRCDAQDNDIQQNNTMMTLIIKTLNILKRCDIQQNDTQNNTQHSKNDVTMRIRTFSITTFNMLTLSITKKYATLSIMMAEFSMMTLTITKKM
jgi:hypothetical protein